MTRVVLLQPDPLVAERLRALIEAVPAWCVVAVVRSIAQAQQAVALHAPQLVVTDLQLPGGDVACDLHRLRAARIVVIAMSDDDPRLLDALCGGADGFFVPGRSLSLVAVIDQVLHGESTMTPQIARRLRQYFDAREADDFIGLPRGTSSLSESEQLLLRWTSEGFLPAEVARGLQQTVRGVGVRVRAIYRKLQSEFEPEALMF